LNWSPPEKVLITGGHEVGGLEAFAEALREGFDELGITGEIIRPSVLLTRWSDLRSYRVLKILSTSAILTVPLVRRAICVAHSTLSARDRGWSNSLAKLLSYRLANLRSSACMVSVSYYVANHLNDVFDVQVDGIIRNPISNFFLETTSKTEERSDLTFVGRLVRCKNVDRLLPAVCDLLRENPQLRCRIVGDGPERAALQSSVASEPRIEFTGTRDKAFVREQLRRSKLFVSGALNEGLGIAYLEALSQGCNVVMPASGGGLEIALDYLGCGLHLMPISLERNSTLLVLRKALQTNPAHFQIQEHTPKTIASTYLQIDRSFRMERLASHETAEVRS
jgi:glycosyltransferase involved in cell wall biosynthesis